MDYTLIEGWFPGKGLCPPGEGSRSCMGLHLPIYHRKSICVLVSLVRKGKVEVWNLLARLGA